MVWRCDDINPDKIPHSMVKLLMSHTVCRLWAWPGSPFGGSDSKMGVAKIEVTLLLYIFFKY